jgi:K+-transporting ATPase KdpF subunit
VDTCNARCDHAILHGRFLRGWFPLRESLPEAEVKQMDLITAVALVLSILLLGYLVVSLLYPEKF